MKRVILVFLLFIFSLLVRQKSSLSSQKLDITSGKVEILSIKNYIINPVMYEYIRRGMEKAEEEKAIFILKLDTPGGLLEPSQKIVKLFLNSSVPVITYITPRGARAASAGVFISYASNIIAMSPSTHIGAAHPIIGNGSWGKLSKQIREKIMNDTLSWAKTIAEGRNRPLDFIQKAVKESISITEKEASNRKICDIVAENIHSLLDKINGRIVNTSEGRAVIKVKESNIENIYLSTREKFLNTIINPNIAYLLFTLGFLGLIVEFIHPGLGLPGVAGLVCVVLSLYAFSILPLNYASIIFIVLGVIFLIAESFTPTFGIFTLGGVTSLLLGSMMFFNQPSLRVSFKVLIPVVLSISAILLFVAGKAIAAQRKKSIAGKEGLIGEEGIVLSAVHKIGKVQVHGEIWNALSDKFINEGERVIVKEVKGLTLKVTKKEGQ